MRKKWKQVHESSFEDDQIMSDKAQYGDSSKLGTCHYPEMSEIGEETENDNPDDEEEDQNEEELEKLRPQIILDQSAQQDREDDPSFDQDDDKGTNIQNGKEIDE